MRVLVSLICLVLCSLVVLPDPIFAASAKKKEDMGSNVNKYFLCKATSYYGEETIDSVTKKEKVDCTVDTSSFRCTTLKSDFNEYTPEGGSYVWRQTRHTRSLDIEGVKRISRSTGSFHDQQIRVSNPSVSAVNALFIDVTLGTCELKSEKLKF